jgi:hypothetical protein
VTMCWIAPARTCPLLTSLDLLLAAMDVGKILAVWSFHWRLQPQRILTRGQLTLAPHPDPLPQGGRGRPVDVHWPPGICLLPSLSKKHPYPGRLEPARPMGIFGSPSPRENGERVGVRGWGQASGYPTSFFIRIEPINKQPNLWVIGTASTALCGGGPPIPKAASPPTGSRLPHAVRHHRMLFHFQRGAAFTRLAQV